MFGRSAEVMRDYGKKGTKLYIEGRIKTTEYPDKTTGDTKHYVSIVCRFFEFM